MILNKSLRILVILIITLLGFFPTGKTASVHAQAGTPSEMLDEINNLRSANGLPPLAVNNYLMLSAQNHADWIAETGQGGHVGVDGTDAQARALAVGYGEGAQVWVTENWARGPGLTVRDCIYTSWNDSAHMDNMLTEWHNEFGAGVALDVQGFTVYVVNFGHTSGSTPAQSDSTPEETESNLPTFETGPTNTPVPFIQPITTATPSPDGSVIHVVAFGQSLWAIADAYGIPLPDLLALNNLTEDSAIYPEQELIIVPGNESSETQDPELEEEAQAEMTPTQMITATKAPIEALEKPQTDAKPAESLNPEETSEPDDRPTRGFLATIFSGDTLWVGIGLIAVSISGIILVLFTSARLK